MRRRRALFHDKGEEEKAHLEPVAVRFVKLVLEFHPVQAQRVQEALEHVHRLSNAAGWI